MSSNTQQIIVALLFAILLALVWPAAGIAFGLLALFCYALALVVTELAVWIRSRK